MPKPKEQAAEREFETDDGLQEDLEKSYAELEKAGDETEVDAAPEKDAKPDTKDAPEKGDEAVPSDKPRDPSGKFAKAEKTEAAAPTIPAAPEHWSQLDKDRYNALPNEIKPLYLEQRGSLEKGYQEKFTKVADYEKEAATLDQIFAPIQSDLAAWGTSRTEAIRRLVGAHLALKQNPQQALAQLARSYGVEMPQAAAQSQGQGEAAMWLDPMAERQYGAIAKEVQGISQMFQQFTSAQQDQANRQLDAHIEQFKAEKNPDGTFKHPYFNDLREDIRFVLMTAAQAKRDMTLAQAYDAACRLHPEISKSILAVQAQADAAKREATRKAEVEKAKKANAARVTATGTPGRPAKERKTLKDELSSAWDDLAAGNA